MAPWSPGCWAASSLRGALGALWLLPRWRRSFLGVLVALVALSAMPALPDNMQHIILAHSLTSNQWLVNWTSSEVKEVEGATGLKVSGDGAMYVARPSQPPRWVKDELAIKVGKTGDGRLFTHTAEQGSKIVADVEFAYSTKYARLALRDEASPPKAMLSRFFQGKSCLFWQLRYFQELHGLTVHAC